MQLEHSAYSNPVPVSAYPADRTVGGILMILAAIGIPLTVIGTVFFAAVQGGIAIFHTVHLGHPVNRFGWSNSMHLAYTLAALTGLVFAGYGIRHSQRQAFIVALVVGGFSLLIHSLNLLAAGAVIYSAARLWANVGPRPR